MKTLRITLITVISSALMILSSNALEIRVGASAGFAHLESSGSETLKDSAVVTTHTEQANAIVPSLFAELSLDNGIGIGYDHITGSADLAGSNQKDQKDNCAGVVASCAGNDTGLNTANAEVDGISTLYLIKTFQNGLFIKAGMSSADVSTTEVLGTGTKYGNVSVDGSHYGVGFERTNDSGIFFRTAVEHTDFDELSLTGDAVGGTASSFNVVKATVDVTAAKFSVGKKF